MASNVTNTQRKPTSLPKIIYLLPILLAFWWLPFSLPLSHTSQSQHATSAQMFEHLLGHVEDTHTLHFGDIHIHLPVILYQWGEGWTFFSSKYLHHHHTHQGFRMVHGKIVNVANHAYVYDFSITKNVVWMFLILLLLLLLFSSCTRYIHRRQGKPAKGIWVLFLFFIRFVRDDIARKHIGPQHYKRFTPYLLTIFFYILFNNLLGLLPEGPNITGNLSAVLTLGLFTAAITWFNASADYWKHIFSPPGVPTFMYPIMVPLELLNLLIKPLILSMRLFANILAGHLLIISIMGMIFVLKTIFA